MNRRQFFKTVAATVAVAVVAPAAGVEVTPASLPKPPQWLWYDAPVRVGWKSYYADHLDTIDAKLLARLNDATKKLEFTPPI